MAVFGSTKAPLKGAGTPNVLKLFINCNYKVRFSSWFRVSSFELKKGGTFIQRWRVPLGFLSGGAFVLLAKPYLWSLMMGGAVALIGLMIRAWAAGHIRKNAALAVSGPYARTRNPLYLGSFILGLGFTIAAANVWLILVFAGLFLGIYLPVMRIEARDVATLFPADYPTYSINVPLFVPRMTIWRAESESKTMNKFDFSLYLKYREYRAALGLLTAWGLLFAKWAYF